MDTVQSTPTTTPLLAHTQPTSTPSAHRPKLSEILADEIAGNFFRNISVDDAFANTFGHDGALAAHRTHHDDIDHLIQLSKQLQRNLGRHDNHIDSDGWHHTIRQRAATTTRGATQPGGTHRAFRVPPLFLHDEHVLHSYAVDLVAESFAAANGGHREAAPRPAEPKRSVATVPDSAHLHCARSTKSARSVKSGLSTRTHSPRVYPKKHSCINLSPAGLSQKKRKPPALIQRRSLDPRQTKSARQYRSPFCDFGTMHPSLRIETDTGTLFPRRVEREVRPANDVEPQMQPLPQSEQGGQDFVTRNIDQQPPEEIQLKTSSEDSRPNGLQITLPPESTRNSVKDEPIAALDRVTQTSPLVSSDSDDSIEAPE